MHTGILLTDLTKAFDSLSHDLLVAKLNSYGFSILSLKMINDYLNPIREGGGGMLNLPPTPQTLVCHLVLGHRIENSSREV